VRARYMGEQIFWPSGTGAVVPHLSPEKFD
jgi:hypothetical protein